MTILCVDDEQHALNVLKASITDAFDKADEAIKLFGSSSAVEAVEFAKNNKCDVAFLDIQMPVMSGLELAKALKEINRNTNIIFVTGYSDYMADALNMHVSGYLQKPVMPEDILNEMQNLRCPITAPPKKVMVQTFGNFEVFVNGKAVKFPRAKSKELFAYLIDRKGASVAYKQCRAVLWEDEPDSLSLKNKFRSSVADLKKTFTQYGIKDVIIKNGQEIAVAQDKVVCDYYLYLQGDISAVNMFAGEYMLQYSWAEFTLGGIEREIHKR